MSASPVRQVFGLLGGLKDKVSTTAAKLAENERVQAGAASARCEGALLRPRCTQPRLRANGILTVLRQKHSSKMRNCTL